jgi:hypothetical protein
MISSTVRTRFWLELCLAGLCGLLGLLTVFWRDWIEALTGFDPDHHDGSVEWMIVVGLLLASVVLSVVARLEWRRLRQSAALAG